jgi:hypothetical protein
VDGKLPEVHWERAIPATKGQSERTVYYY